MPVAIAEQNGQKIKRWTIVNDTKIHRIFTTSKHIMAQQEKEFWQGTNFWVSLALAVGGLWSGFSASDAADAIGYFFATIGSLFAIREKVKDSTINWREWISSPNTWQYLAAVFISIFPTLSPELFQRLNDLVASLISGNWQGVIGAAFSILTMLYYIFRKPKV